MAIKKDYGLVVNYRLGMSTAKEMYDGILTEEQINQVEEQMNKTFSIPNAYHRIDGVEGTKEKLDIKLNIYSNDLGIKLITSKTYSFVPSVEDNSSNYHKQGYEYLKTLPEFENSVDC
ncbi:hypothetical protein BSK46_14185 [Paenibacillus odorifer]|uniref:hypothetical protein n=1 Tax=Paenibacillus TaxID=44249 RepID=UPI00097A63DE|nr:hypothetical protein [Paenibacillus odorifer]OME37875.1 hypothetical protein BSK46_14185 [Paenibacillus odorifer]